MEEEMYISNKTWDDWLLANPNLANLDQTDLLVSLPIKPYSFGWVEMPPPNDYDTEEEPF